MWGQLFNDFGFRDFIFLWDFFTILCACEDSHSFMGGSDAVHCVWVSLTGTTVAPSWVHLSLVGNWFHNYTHSVTLFVGMGPLNVVFMGPRPGNVARSI